MSFWRNQLSGPTDPAIDAAWETRRPRKGFFTDTSICIGCKACEVACKEWNHVPMDDLGFRGTSYDNTGGLGASTWRHVAFVEQGTERIARAKESGRRLVELGMPAVRSSQQTTEWGPAEVQEPQMAVADPGDAAYAAANPVTAMLREQDDDTLPAVRWLMSSDVCKHCTHAGCLDVCPTGALFRTEFGTVVVQADVCNGCGYCVGSCPFGVIERRPDGIVSTGGAPEKVLNGGIAQKCTLCYDRLKVGEQPACAKACPTTSIKFGDLTEMRRLAQERLDELHAQGHTEARLYGANEYDGVGGTGSIFLLLDEPEVYGLPPDPVVTTHDLPHMFRLAGWAGVSMLATAALTFLVGGRR